MIRGSFKGKFDRSRYDLLSPLSVFVSIDKSGILYRSPSKIVASQLWKSVVLKIFVLRHPDFYFRNKRDLTDIAKPNLA